jgi:hypothetical protein
VFPELVIQEFEYGGTGTPEWPIKKRNPKNGKKISKNQFLIDSNRQTGQCHTYIGIYIDTLAYTYIHGKPPYINGRCTYRPSGGESSLIIGWYIPAIRQGDLLD